MSDTDVRPAMTREGLLAIIGPLIALVCIFAAILLSSWFTWEGNALSDLGNYDNGLLAAIVFNSGLVATGVVLLYFTFWFFKKLKDLPTRIGLLPFFSALVFLILIGILSENAGRVHFYVSIGFFASFPFAMWIIALGFLRYRHLWWFSIVSFVVPFFSIYMWVGWFGGMFPLWTGNAIPEFTTALTAIAWLWIIWILYYKDRLTMLLK
ncbi:MAG: DUF998 domain-containing protein [Candidatus Thorarchaeota archaeon]